MHMDYPWTRDIVLFDFIIFEIANGRLI